MVEFNAADLLAPDGRLDATWFNGKTVDQVVAILSGIADDLIDNGRVDSLDGDDANQYAAIEAWTYYGGFNWIADDLATRVGTIVIPNEATKQTTVEGPTYFRNRAKDYLAIFAALVPEAVVVSQKPRSHSLTARFRP